ncbi:hypothetical protein D7Z26_07315 [Cohnella endophytica]|uniref:Uncharacterized protein n=1 Tax=Cohnella endophytica TaxID=2419778 RepID=A0A494Y3F9_9BACL|nr:hypothetical protein [Cohnella endophytica]RKP55031.1 hypothetical protein D7Z26_07315 [Cohnella endophytica]
MIIQIAKIGLLAVISLWASFYIGSLTPQLWRQKNYRGSVGIAVLACLTFILPLAFAQFGNG